MQVKSVAECSPWSILQYFEPSSSYLPFVIKIFVFFYFWLAVLHRFYCINFVFLSDNIQDSLARHTRAAGWVLVTVVDLVVEEDTGVAEEDLEVVVVMAVVVTAVVVEDLAVEEEDLVGEVEDLEVAVVEDLAVVVAVASEEVDTEVEGADSNSKWQCIIWYCKICVKRPTSKRPQIGFQDRLSLNAGQKYCRMLQGEHSAILLTFIKPPFVIKILVLSIFEWLFYTGFTVNIGMEEKWIGQLG